MKLLQVLGHQKGINFQVSGSFFPNRSNWTASRLPLVLPSKNGPSCRHSWNLLPLCESSKIEHIMKEERHEDHVIDGSLSNFWPDQFLIHRMFGLPVLRCQKQKWRN